MLKRLKSVSMLLFLGTFSTGTISAVTASEVNASAIVQQNETCKGIVKDATEIHYWCFCNSERNHQRSNYRL